MGRLGPRRRRGRDRADLAQLGPDLRVLRGPGAATSTSFVKVARPGALTTTSRAPTPTAIGADRGVVPATTPSMLTVAPTTFDVSVMVPTRAARSASSRSTSCR